MAREQKNLFWDFDYTKDANYLKSPFPGMMSSVPVASVPPAGHNSGAPPLIKRSLVSLFVSNWPIGGSQSSRTTCPPTSHNLIHTFYCAENITYIMEKYYNICRIFPSVFTVSKLAWIMSWRIVVDRDWVLRRDYALQHLAVVTSSMMIAHQWNYGDIHQSTGSGLAQERWSGKS